MKNASPILSAILLLICFSGANISAETADAAPAMETFWMTGEKARDEGFVLLNGEPFPLSEQSGRILVIGFAYNALTNKFQDFVNDMEHLAASYAGQTNVLFLCIYGSDTLPPEAILPLTQRETPNFKIGVHTSKSIYYGGSFCIVNQDSIVGKHLPYYSPTHTKASIRQELERILEQTKVEKGASFMPELEWSFLSGHPVPDTTILLPDGNMLSLADWTGKTVLLAVGYVQPDKERPEPFNILTTLAEEFSDHPDIRLLGIACAVNISREALNDTIQEWNLPFPVGTMDHIPFHGNHGYSSFVVIDVNGDIQGSFDGWSHSRADELKAVLKALSDAPEPPPISKALPDDKRHAKDRVERTSLSGRPAPELEFPLLNGGTFRLSDHRGKAIVLDFWATWCGPCIHSFPKIADVERYFEGNTNVLIVGVCLDGVENTTRVRELVEEHGLHHPIPLADGWEDGAAYNVIGIPCVVLIAPDGTVQGRVDNFADKATIIVTALESILAGEKLKSSQLITDKELEYVTTYDPRERGTHQKMNEAAFTLSHAIPLEGTPEPDSYVIDYERLGTLRYTIPPKWIAFCRENVLTVLNPETGAIHATRTLPDNFSYTLSGNLAYLQTSQGGIFIDYGNSVLVGIPLDETQEPWRRELFNIDGTRIYPLPMPNGDDLFMLSPSHSNHQAFFDAEGNLMFAQTLPYPLQQCTIVQREDGRITFVLVSTDEVKYYDLTPSLPK